MGVRKSWMSGVWLAAGLLAAGSVQPESLRGQLISIRTVPVSQAHQFDLLPSRSMGMGGLGFAVADSLLDPFLNPAHGGHTSTFFSSPGLYGVSQGAGSGRSLPIGAVFAGDRWFGSLAVALQQVDPSEQNVFFGNIFSCPTCLASGIDPNRIRSPRGNEYATASVGRRLSDRWSLGASASWSGLDGVDGTDLLYAGSAQIDQAGTTWDLRMGAIREWEDGQVLEVLGLHHRYDMSHDVHYLDPFWDPNLQQVSQRPRLEQNLDRTHTWGLHLEYRHPIGSQGWQVGGSGTFNYKAHPKIPNYEIMNIPRDPGFSRAYNAGIGIGRHVGSAVLGAEVIYEPIWSHTWADSERPVETVTGETILPGGKTIENRFRFDNLAFRIGVSDEILLDASETGLGVSMGLSARATRYHLHQRDHVQLTRRELREDWVEWGPTWGLSLRRPGFEVRYRGFVTDGTGRPGVGGVGRCFDFCLEDVAVAAAGGTNILAAPSGPLTLDPVRVTAHQLTLSFPLNLGAMRGTGRPEENDR